MSNKGTTVFEPGRDIPVAVRADVAVCGGGVAGLAAAIASARNGAETVLVERNGYAGGVATASMMPVLVVSFEGLQGVGAEIFERMEGLGAASRSEADVVCFDPETLKFVALEMIREAGVRLLLHSWVAAPYVEGDRLAGVIVENKSGRQAILAGVVVDTTGDGDVAARAGAPFHKGREQDGKMRPVSLLFRMANVDLEKVAGYMAANPGQFSRSPSRRALDRERNVIRVMGFYDLMNQARERGEIDAGLHYLRLEGGNSDAGIVIVNTTRVYDVDGTDAWDLSRGEVEARLQVQQLVGFLRRYVPGFERASLVDVSQSLGVRETRHIMGDYVLTGEDAAGSRVFPDSVGQVRVHHTRGVEVHSPDGDEGSERDTKMRYLVEPAVHFHIPYRSLLPRGVEGLLVAGRCISATHEADGWVRGMNVCLLDGQAAVTAAALAARHGVTPRALNVSLLQQTLASQGVDFGAAGVPLEAPEPR